MVLDIKGRYILLFICVSACFIEFVRSKVAYAKVNGTCVDDARYDEDFSSDFYCGSIISWPIPKDDFYSQTNHRIALQRYQELFRKWETKTDRLGLEDCLGIGWFFFCSTAIPYCNKVTQQVSTKTCNSACDLFKFRCPDVLIIIFLFSYLFYIGNRFVCQILC